MKNVYFMIKELETELTRLKDIAENSEGVHWKYWAALTFTLGGLRMLKPFF